MVKTISNFIQDLEDELVSQEDFNQGICNLFHQLASILPRADERRELFPAAEQETLYASPALRGALLFRNFVQATLLHRGIVEAKFEYETSAGPQDQLRATNPALLSGLRGLAYLIQHDVPRPYRETIGKAFNTRLAAMGDLVLGAYFSARSAKRLEPLGKSNTTTSHANAGTQVTNNTNSTRSLGDILEKLYGASTNSERPVDSSAAARMALAVWLFLLSNNNFEKLAPQLSKDETTTALILLEWWGGSIDFSGPSAKSRLAVLESALSGIFAYDLVDGSGYQNTMLHLFYLEFVPHADGGALQNIRPIFRGKGACVAAAQRLAMSVYQSLSAKHGLWPSHELETKGVHQEKTSEMAAHRNSAPGATISTCWWLQDEEAEEAGIPYYLWDVQQRRTVSSKSLGGCVVEYTAISHTWGRWKTEGPCVHVDGVDEWTVPQNSKFNVAELPRILASAVLATRFVWFDLLCIPQESENERLVAIARQEIARQAKIFRNATNAVAWINDVEGWHGLHVAVRQLAIQYLRAKNELPSWTVDLADRDEGELEIFCAPDGLHGEVNGWFSSLWTLQELCLRPDMMLADRDWNFFGVEGPKRTVVRIDDLVALSVQVNMHSSNNASFSSLTKGQPPCGKLALALDTVFNSTGLAVLPNASRTTILMLGNHRHCTASRAEAIMSAVGATDWYEGKHKRRCSPNIQDPSRTSNQSQQSSQARYPLLFLREAARKIGPEFYAWRLKPLETNTLLMQGLWGQSLGTLMPFGTEAAGRTVSMTGGAHAAAHPSVSTWTIQSDYSVDISQAGIVAYTGKQQRSRPRTIIAEIDVTYVPPGHHYHDGATLRRIMQRERVDLADWVDGFYPHTRNFAVCLHYGRPTDGVLLKETVTGDLVKVGSFCIPDYHHAYVHEPPETYNVTWRVL
ncbi:hypothetical protein BJY01DRAFT_245059 [Aspergillus pseudoustus]|uniref:Heterokaryon incompatibility domain-containing protein n=1 Tax=Aspergillus pseudoustus TaxID=1810923 RepID=A0ABR4KFS8_9EURO